MSDRVSLAIVVWWHGLRALRASQEETAKILNDITAHTQVILAQNRDVLRRLEP